MCIQDKLVDQSQLRLHAIMDDHLRAAYLQGAVTELLEKWEDLLEDQYLRLSFISTYMDVMIKMICRKWGGCSGFNKSLLQTLSYKISPIGENEMVVPFTHF
jgi:hypothetical protein